MDDLLPYYERELGIFRDYAREFSERFPKTAGQLFVAGESKDDPHVERMIQSFALLTARISKKLEEDYPAFTESMFEASYPHFLRPLPSYSVARIDYRNFVDPSATQTVRRGTLMYATASTNVTCRFRTVYDLELGPLSIMGARFSPIISAPAGLRLPPAASSCISIDIHGASLVKHFPLQGKLRLFIDGEPSFRATLIDALFLHAAGACVQSDEGGPWRQLAEVPVALAGFNDDESMAPVTARTHPAFRLLTEYFCYAEKFNFIDLDLAGIGALLPAGSDRFTLHLPLTGLGADSDAARLLASISPARLLLNCTPVINLFEKNADPINMKHAAVDYPVLADSHLAKGFEVHSVTKVRLIRSTRNGSDVTELAPLYGVNGDASVNLNKANYWIVRRDAAIAAVSPGHEYRIALIDQNFDLHNEPTDTLSMDLLCTNRDLPAQLPIGAEAGDLRAESMFIDSPIRLLRKPSNTCRFASDKGAHWRLISHMTLSHATLDADGLPELRAMLALYNLTRSAIVQRQINGIVGLECGAVRAWVRTHPVASLMPGIGIRLTVDERAFAGSSLYAFAQVMDHYFSLNGQLNCFTQLEIVSQQTGEAILKCKPRSLENFQT